MEGKVTVDGKLACEAIVMCQLVPRGTKAAESEAARDSAQPAPELVSNE